MGFLLGAYGKLAAGSRMRAIQSRLLRVSAKVRRVSRQVGEMEKMIDRQQKSMEQSLTLQNSTAKQMFQNTMYGAMMQYKGEGNITVADAMQKMQGGNLSNEEIQKYSSIVSTAQSQYQQQVSSMSSYCDTQSAMQKQQIADYIENMRETMLEPLKDEEDSLQLEKETLETQLTVAKQDYEFCQKMEQEDAKMLAPHYSGGQG